MSILQIDRALAAVAVSGRHLPNPGEPELSHEINALADCYGPDALLARMVNHKVVGLVLAVMHSRAAKPLARVLAPYTLRVQHEAAQQQAGLQFVLSVLHDLPVILLKGSALRELVYPVAWHRSMADLDLWVAPDQVEYATGKLIAAGFVQGRKSTLDGHHDAPLVKQGVAVELHRFFVGGGCADSWDEVFPRAVRLDRPGQVFRPNTTDMIWQAWHHTFRSAIQWIPWQLCGVADLVRLLALPDVNWSIAGRWTGLTRLRQLGELPSGILDKFTDQLPALDGPFDRPNYGNEYTLPWLRYRPSDWWLAMRHGLYGESIAVCRRRHWGDLLMQFTGYSDPASIYSEAQWAT